jgi:hypothetical protein
VTQSIPCTDDRYGEDVVTGSPKYRATAKRPYSLPFSDGPFSDIHVGSERTGVGLLYSLTVSSGFAVARDTVPFG